ncbi:GNAT family N-acetyltransferase [Bradyrhizobium diazoefficiens]|uniref:GNAT family N-acetyltransferase n=1 Tax=Bradyrhizobium diazoefficiens TaxID=1355477 RepID=UPI001B8D6C07|nr:GNAT family N-acetyltransferase [Bradyrhizobium diazoefficiens]MBR0921206.1 GNAT family N-acetyltransferase [Bradyrhizobium diazoefficiens]
MLANMQSETQYKIRRAQNKDALEFRAPTAPDPSSLAAFHDILAQFAAEKGVSPARMKCLQAAAKAGVLRLGGMVHEGEVLVWHSYLLIGSRVRPMHSASLFRGQAPARRNLIGRANRLLHWLEMQHFRDAGATLYDFGGWCAGQRPRRFPARQPLQGRLRRHRTPRS